MHLQKGNFCYDITMNQLNSNKILSDLKIRLYPASCLLAFLVLVFSGSAFAEKGDTSVHTVAPLSPGMETLPSTQGTIGVASPSPKTQYGRFRADFPLIPPFILKQAGYILPFPESEGSIVENYLKRARLGTGDFVYLDIGSEKGVSTGDRFTVSRPEKYIYHPVLKTAAAGISKYRGLLSMQDGLPLGYLINILGELEVVEVNANESKAVIRESYQEMMNGDRIITQRTPPPLIVNEEPEEKDIDGYIVASKNVSSSMVGANAIVYLDVGSEQTVAPGDRFEAYEIPAINDKKTFSPHVVGELLVIDTQNNTATAIILKSSIELQVGQKIRYKK